MKRIVPVLFFCLQVILLAMLLTLWWAHKNNNLYSNGKWLVGKDEGKFVFYTYDYMFHPLEDKRVNLDLNMGNQELLYHEPEKSTSALESMSFEAALSDKTYLWIELEKQGLQLLACRLSRYHGYESGFYRYNEDGLLVSFTPLAEKDFYASSHWTGFEVKSENGQWRLFQGDKLLGQVAKGGKGGYFGFRGSGNVSGRVYIRDINISLINPQKPGQHWQVSENFSPDPFNGDTLTVAFVAALLVILLRLGRQRLIVSGLNLQGGRFYGLCDATLFSLLLLAGFFLPTSQSGVHLPALLVCGELTSAICLGVSRKRFPEQSGSGIAVCWQVVALVLICLLAVIAFARHGEWLGRADRSVWSKLKNVHPDAFVISPQLRTDIGGYLLKKDTVLEPGRPVFTSGNAFNSQLVELEFTMREGTTFDIALQQQSFQTKGDLGGELLPLQRRLIRLSTRQGVPWGVSSGSRTLTSPFFPIRGSLKTDGLNHLKIMATADGLEIKLNDDWTRLSHLPELSYGENGFSVLDGVVVLHRVEVSSFEGIGKSRFFLPLMGALLPVLFWLLLSVLLFPLGKKGAAGSLRLALIALFLPVSYLLFCLALPTTTLAYLGVFRVGWLDLALGGMVLSLFHFFGLKRSVRRKSGPLVANILVLLLLFFAVLFTWDILLPANHPLRLRFAKEAIAPGGEVENDATFSGPWYAANSTSIANTYVWHQRFGGKEIRQEKPEGTVRIFTMGGSQAWGSGAADSRSTYDGLLEKNLLAEGLPVEVYNGGINGAGIHQVYHTFKGLIMGFHPDVLVLDVGLNDSTTLHRIKDDDARARHRQALIDDFRAILELCQKNGVQVLWVEEAMNHESSLRKDEKLYAGLAQACARAGVATLDAYSLFADMQKTNMFWWDPAHFTPAGQKALADVLTEPVTVLVKQYKENKNDDR